MLEPRRVVRDVEHERAVACEGQRDLSALEIVRIRGRRSTQHDGDRDHGTQSSQSSRTTQGRDMSLRPSRALRSMTRHFRYHTQPMMMSALLLAALVAQAAPSTI